MAQVNAPSPPSSPISPASPTSPSSSRWPEPAPLSSRNRTSTSGSLASNATSRLRSASLKLLEADPPLGMWAATGSAAAKVHSISEIRRGSLSGGLRSRTNSDNTGIGEAGRRRFSRTGTGLSTSSAKSGRLLGKEKITTTETEPIPGMPRELLSVDGAEAPLMTIPSAPRSTAESSTGGEMPNAKPSTPSGSSTSATAGTAQQNSARVTYENGYQPPPKLPWTTSTAHALKAFWKWFLTIPGFLITLYGLNVVAWGGMLFLLLCNAAPAMCHLDHPSDDPCNDLYSPRRIWIEIDSQILNALFCVTGFGLVPWRFRDLWWWGVWRFGWGKKTWGATRAQRKSYGVRKLAGIHRGWFRLPGSENLPPLYPASRDAAEGEEEVADSNPAVPVPASKAPDPPPTGIRAPPTKSWKLDFVIWCNVMNTFLQACLCGFMWALNRFDRPSWSTGLFVALACIAAGLGGLVMFLVGKANKKIEGVPMPAREGERDVENGAKKGKERKSKEGIELREQPVAKEEPS